MAAVTLDILQTGSGSHSLSVQTGDTVTLELASVVENSVLANAVSALAGLGQVTGITFAVNATGGAT